MLRKITWQLMPRVQESCTCEWSLALHGACSSCVARSLLCDTSGKVMHTRQAETELIHVSLLHSTSNSLSDGFTMKDALRTYTAMQDVYNGDSIGAPWAIIK